MKFVWILLVLAAATSCNDGSIVSVDNSLEQGLVSNTCNYSWRRARWFFSSTPDMPREFRYDMPVRTTDTFANWSGASGKLQLREGLCGGVGAYCFGKHARTFSNEGDRTVFVNYDTSDGPVRRRVDEGETSGTDGDILSVECPRSTCNACFTACRVAGGTQGTGQASIEACQSECLEGCIP